MTSSHLFYYKTQRGTGLVLLHIDHGTGEFIDAVTVFSRIFKKIQDGRRSEGSDCWGCEQIFGGSVGSSSQPSTEQVIRHQGTKTESEEGARIQQEGEQVKIQGDKIEESLEAIGDEEMAEAAEKLTEGKSLLDTQQKLIRIADRETDGWEVVKHYISN